jgi:hypothetical protein
MVRYLRIQTLKKVIRMKKILLFSTALIFSTITVFAQFNYNLIVQIQSYTPLTTGTVVNGTAAWDEEAYTMPIGFNFILNGTDTMSRLTLFAGNYFSADSTDTMALNVFTPIGADLWDRANVSASNSVSPIRYQLTGTSPNRIFKFEVFNAGFYDEFNGTAQTNNDSVSYQVWLYEGSNILEFHYGPRRITYPNDYFFPVGKPTVGYFKNLDFNTFSVDNLYYLKGDPAVPTIDSTNNLLTFTGGLNSFPVGGMVYRFVPKSLGVNDINDLDAILLYPTITAGRLNIVSNLNSMVKYQVLSLEGKLLKTGELVKGKNMVNAGDLAAGSYLVRLESPGGRRTIKFQKQ